MKKPWSAEDSAELARLYPAHSARTIAKLMHRAHSTITRKIQQLHNQGVPAFEHLWKKPDTDFLLANWSTMSAGQIARRLGRTRSSVIGKIGRLRADKLLPPTVEKRYTQDPMANTKQASRPKAPKPPRTKQPANGVAAPPLAPLAPLSFYQAHELSHHFVVRPQWLTFAELQPHHCKWPIGEGAELRFCGADALAHKPYCLEHCLLGYHFDRREEKRT